MLSNKILLEIFSTIALILLIFIIPNIVFASSHHNHSNSHAPIGVMRDHIHNKGEMMLSYRTSLMSMKGMRNGNDKVSDNEVLDNYMMSPTKMNIKMHMLGVMYGLTDSFTVLVMGSAIEKEMYMVNSSQVKSKQQSNGIGDTKISTLYQFYDSGKNKLQFNFGLSLPTGNINKVYQGNHLAYPMQIGSGSYELLPGISYGHVGNNYSYGGQINSVFRLNNNSSGYKFGDSYNATTWVSKKINKSFSLSSRLNYNKIESIAGSDLSLNSASPLNDANFSSKESLDLLFGVGFAMQDGGLSGNRLALEFAIPLYQRYDGYQIDTDYKVILGWQKEL